MFGHVVKTIILTIFAIIIFHFVIEHTKNIWHIPQHADYDASYKKIVNLLETLPDEPQASQAPQVPQILQNTQGPLVPISENYISDVTEISKLDTYNPPPPSKSSMTEPTEAEPIEAESMEAESMEAESIEAESMEAELNEYIANIT